MQALYCWRDLFILYHFEPQLRTRINRVLRHNSDGEVSSCGNLSIFSHPGWPVPKNIVKERYLSEIEFKQARVIFEQFISYNIINWYIVKFLINKIVNIYYPKTHSWLNLKSFDYKINNFSRGLEHM